MFYNNSDQYASDDDNNEQYVQAEEEETQNEEKLREEIDRLRKIVINELPEYQFSNYSKNGGKIKQE